MNDYMIAVILGIVEGFTEYLPVSSTGHMILVGDWLGFDGPRASVFEVFIQLGVQAFLVGAFQMLALWPGFSRSGSTIAGGLFLGMSRKAAADFSFIIAVPVMIVACFYDLLKSLSYLSSNDLIMIAIGFVTAFIVAYVSVLWFLKFLNKSTLASFAYYRFVVALVSFLHFFVLN